jgi:hypothetical protein
MARAAHSQQEDRICRHSQTNDHWDLCRKIYADKVDIPKKRETKISKDEEKSENRKIGIWSNNR